MAFQRDEERAMHNASRCTDVRAKAVDLDKWSKMSAALAKAIFSWRTLIEIATYLYQELGVHMTAMYQIQQHPTGRLGFISATATHLKLVLKQKDPNNSNLASQISSFQFCANVSEIYNLRLLKMDKMIRWNNIEKYEAQMIKNLEYFQRLRDTQLARRDAGFEDWENTVIAKETWDIMRISARGFFSYCRYMIEYAMHTSARNPTQLPSRRVFAKFAVTPAHSNSSFIELWFGIVRYMGFDEALKYAFSIANRGWEFSKCVRAIQCTTLWMLVSSCMILRLAL